VALSGDGLLIAAGSAHAAVFRVVVVEVSDTAMYMIENIRATMKRLKLDGPGFGGGLSLGVVPQKRAQWWYVRLQQSCSPMTALRRCHRQPDERPLLAELGQSGRESYMLLTAVTTPSDTPIGLLATAIVIL
jgi:hypothetical protein